MPIETFIYLPNADKKWRLKGENGVTGVTKDGKEDIIFKITDNEGSYSADHGLEFKTDLPKVIYYYQGKSVMTNLPAPGKYAPPSDFPVHADITPI